MRPGLSILRLVAIAAVLIAAGAVRADVPRNFHYQASLQDPTGRPVQGLADFRIALFDAGSGGTEIWHATPILPVQDGQLDLVLPIFQASFDDTTWDAILGAAELWVELEVFKVDDLAVNWLFPRQRILTSGYAFQAASIDGARGGSIQGDLEIDGVLRLPDGIELEASGGALEIRAASTTIQIAPDGAITITSASDVTVSGGRDVTLQAGRNLTLGAVGGFSLTAGDATVSVGDMQLDATGLLALDGERGLELSSADRISITGDTVSQTAAKTYEVSAADLSVTATSNMSMNIQRVLQVLAGQTIDMQSGDLVSIDAPNVFIRGVTP